MFPLKFCLLAVWSIVTGRGARVVPSPVQLGSKVLSSPGSAQRGYYEGAPRPVFGTSYGADPKHPRAGQVIGRSATNPSATPALASMIGISRTPLRMQRKNFVGLGERWRHRARRLALQAQGSEGTSEIDTGKLEPLKLAGTGMGLLKPVFALEAKLQAGSYDQDAVRKALCKEARSAPVVIYTYSLSPFSTEATKLLDSLGANYKEVELGPEWFLLSGEGAAKRAELSEIFGRSSMPHIFIGGRSIGGLTEGNPGLIPLYESGELQDALEKVGSIPNENPFGFFLWSGDAEKVQVGTEFSEP